MRVVPTEELRLVFLLFGFGGGMGEGPGKVVYGGCWLTMVCF